METELLQPEFQSLPLNWNANQKDIYYICEQYFKLSLRCAKNPELLKAFQDPSKTVAFLTDGKNKDGYVWKDTENEYWKGCGMKLPEHTKVILDYDTSWPTLYFTKKGNEQETITIKESPLFVQVFSSGSSGIKTIKRELLPESDESKVILPFNVGDLTSYEAILIMPCFIPDKDMLTKVYCNDKKEAAEIILTTC
ncbi:hypothetical protein [Aquimarina longa]|uniref:hypothetical protein n=1 Tax=Aquimarina longa TaxID=1080221 RepID=UPI0007837032|nr:hypothetical protein [Aquimarina longa]